jgi:hypothetical protein
MPNIRLALAALVRVKAAGFHRDKWLGRLRLRRRPQHQPGHHQHVGRRGEDPGPHHRPLWQTAAATSACASSLIAELDGSSSVQGVVFGRFGSRFQELGQQLQHLRVGVANSLTEWTAGPSES